MSTEITLCIEDDGTMNVEVGEKEEAPQVEQAEGGNKVPVKNIEEAISLIKQFAGEASMGPAEKDISQEGAEAPTNPDVATGEEEQSMMGAFRGMR